MDTKSGDNHAQTEAQVEEQSVSQSGVNRRSFIQQAGAIALGLGLSELPFNLASSKRHTQFQDYAQALAATEGRKLALLIGIDNYLESTLPVGQAESAKLAGATTDVALQKELLIHRFGFAPADIVCLTNQQATREGIYDAFVSHLLRQADAGDTVLFHFSGYGSRVQIKSLSQNTAQNTDQSTTQSRISQQTLRSLVPYDGLIPIETRPALNDILEIELKALLKQLKTKNITTVIDAGFVDIVLPLSGGLRSRARSEVITGQLPAPFELLTSQRPAKDTDTFPGTLLRGADISDVVLERQWNDFNAGAFTYVLTQHLWNAPSPANTKRSMARVQETLLRWGGSNQQPVIKGSRDRTKNHPIYGTSLIEASRGEGIITALSEDGRSVELWLGGLPPRVLEYLEEPAVMSCNGRRLKVRSHSGLTAKAKLVNDPSNNGAPLQVGQPVLESIRALPKTPNLVVALDSRLERIERVDATSALSSLTFVTSTSDTGLPADCLLAKPIDTAPSTLNASLKPIRFAQAKPTPVETTPVEEIPADEIGKVGYGLFSLTRSLIPGTLSLQEEAIKPAIQRLSAKLRALVALKMLRLSENRTASQLPVRVTLEQVDEKEAKTLISRQTFKEEQKGKKETEGFIPEIPVGSRVRYYLFNDSDQPLYYTLINVDPRERLSAFCPTEADASEPTNTEVNTGEQGIPAISAASIAPGSSVAIPSVDLDWAVEMPTGPVETYIVCTTRPLNNTFKLLSADINTTGQRIDPLPNPLDVVKAILSDINSGDDANSYTLNMAEWATLNFTYQTI